MIYEGFIEQFNHVLGILCPELVIPANGFITFTEGFSSEIEFMTNASYGCDPGYGLTGGDRIRTCVGSQSGPGQWSGTPPQCQGKYYINCYAFSSITGTHKLMIVSMQVLKKNHYLQ